MPRRKWPAADFAERLIALRKARGLTQTQLAKLIGSSQRAICYYETEAKFPPAPVLALLAQSLKVTTDELLGLKPVSDTGAWLPPSERRLWKKFREVLDFPVRDQRVVIRLISSLAKAQQLSHRAA